MLADLHNHSCLSPCGSIDLTPRHLLEMGAAQGLKLMALTDHNSSLNCTSFAKLSVKYGIIPIFGMEASTSEDIHVLCLFSNLEASLDFGKYIYSYLPPYVNNPKRTGEQVYLDENEKIAGKVDYFLVNPLDISIYNIGEKVIEYGGIVIPAHVDRYALSMTSQLGFIVKGPWAALECVHIPPTSLNGSPLETLGYPLTVSSDAHYPDHVGRRSFELDVTPEELQPGGSGTEVNMEAFKQALNKRLCVL